MTLFYLIRHGEPDWQINEHYKLKGHGRDLAPLTSRGILQVYDTSKDPRLRKAELIISSPYTRAMQTSAILSKELSLDIAVELDLREWQPDLTFEYDSLERLNQLVQDYERCGGMYPPGETRLWESKTMLKSRMDSVLRKYSEHEVVIVVGHGMAFRTQVEREDIPCASITEYKID
ncbi:histidine phosphatase family protein [Paenibacillus zanthoxyli]|uniref:histidine phosphatase family protein n=1 Tax=Paenibacillus zanthoxyli TaxID=369399 RepID=UPI00047095E4|nr:histidine phosphatase family protein [Paenibacillus zanthoxyli]